MRWLWVKEPVEKDLMIVTIRGVRISKVLVSVSWMEIAVGTPGGISGIHTVEEENNLMDLQEEVLEIFDHVLRF